MVKSKYINSILFALAFLAAVVPAGKVTAQEIDLHFGKKALPSIEVHIGAAARAKQKAAAQRDIQVKEIHERELETLEARKPEEPVHTGDDEQGTQEVLENARQEIEEADRFQTETRQRLEQASADSERQFKMSEEERKRLALERVRKLTEEIKKRQGGKASAAKESGEERDISGLPLSMQKSRGVISQRVDKYEEEADEEDVVEFSSSGLDIEEENRSDSEGELSNSAIAPVKIIELKDRDVRAVEEEEPSLVNVPELDRNKDRSMEVSVDREMEDLERQFRNITDRGVTIEQEEVLDVEGQEEPVVEQKKQPPVTSIAKKVEKKITPPASLAKKEEKAAKPAEVAPPVVVAEKKQPKVEPTKNEEVVAVVTIPPQGQEVAEPVVINIPSAKESSGDKLSIASMFSRHESEVPMPLSMRKKYEDGSAAASPVESVELEQGDVGEPASILPSGLAVSGKSVAKSEPVKQPERIEIASAPVQDFSKVDSSSGALVSIGFLQDATDVSESALIDINKIIDQMKSDAQKRLNIVGYASNPDDTSSTARRISLKRALAVRKRIVDSGIDSTRINVQALGNQIKDEGAKDRVDVFFVGEKG